MTIPALSAAARDLILFFESMSERPEVPGYRSGITLGHGIDIGADPASVALLKPYVTEDQYARLTRIARLKLVGQDARDELRTVSDVRIDREAAGKIFDLKIAQVAADAAKFFPGSADLPPDSFGALVSLCFNRGFSIGVQGQPSWDSRREMRAVRALIIDRLPAQVPAQIAAMARLWPGTSGTNGLQTRRRREAALFARGLRDAGLYDAEAVLWGDRGAAVGHLQGRLCDLGAGIVADGVFGHGTLGAVLQAQSNVGLAQNGLVDADTRHKLGV